MDDLSRDVIMSALRRSTELGYTYLNNAKAGCSTIKFALWHKEHDLGRIDDLPSPIELHGRGFWDYTFDWSRTYTFSFVRNPFARALSCYLDKIVKPNIIRTRFCMQFGYGRDASISFSDFLRHVCASDDDDQHWRPQHRNILLGAIPIDFVGSLETFDQDFQNVASHLGLAVAPVRNSHGTAAAQKVASAYTDADLERVRTKYARDFELFGYDPDRPTAPPVRTGHAYLETVEDQRLFFRSVTCPDERRARGFARKAIARNPTPGYYAHLIDLLHQKRKTQRAVAVLEEALGRWPRSHLLLHLRAENLHKQGRTRDALELISTVAGERPYLARHLLLQAHLLIRCGRPNEAERVLADALPLSPRNARAQQLRQIAEAMV